MDILFAAMIFFHISLSAPVSIQFLHFPLSCLLQQTTKPAKRQKPAPDTRLRPRLAFFGAPPACYSWFLILSIRKASPVGKRKVKVVHRTKDGGFAVFAETAFVGSPLAAPSARPVSVVSIGDSL